MLSQHVINNIDVKDNGSLFIDDDRSILISISAFGTLRRDLIRNIGNDRIKGFLNRYGWKLGEEDAKKVLNHKAKSIKEAIYYGPILHKMKGHVTVETTKLEVKPNNEQLSVYMEGTWEDSYEAVEHLSQFGTSTSPICYTLTGYASGYLTTLCNQTVIFKELSCQAEGNGKCKWVGKSLDYWGEDIHDELQFYEGTSIVEELEITYEELLRERNNLEKNSIIHKKLTEEVLEGNNLHSIVNTVYDTLNIPGVITDANHHPLAAQGLSESSIDEMNIEFKSYLRDKQSSLHKDNGQDYPPIYKTTKFKLPTHIRLITPIILEKKIIGYCSFIYPNDQIMDLKTDIMTLERIAIVSSLYLLLERTKFDNDRRIEGHFLNEILRGEFENKEEILRRGKLLQLDLSQPYRFITVKYQLEQKATEKELSFHEELLDQTATYFKQEKMLIGSRGNTIIFLVPDDQMNQEQLKNHFQAYLDFLCQHHPTTLFYAGISKTSENITNANESHNESLIALRMATPNNKIFFFESIGIIGPLLNKNNENEVKKIASNVLGKLLEHLDDKKVELLKTLYAFLLNGGNYEQTSNDIALSLSGLRYRLAKIEDLLDHQLKDPFYNHQLLMALQSLILIGELELHD
ncbi:XylR N-terminal domain-containing protein [Aquibacillus sediminis]|uniref:XylR N-terminal domain-containing protein n=1 Tax=Aquibacillus sediminis TaxID=2574734 RepID=UPI001486E5DE|nr:XylR N-terminal domain-containing protein [Aquibacillus sediminis]